MKGMMLPITVIPAATSAPAAEPTADIVMVLDDYSYETSAEIKAGRRTIRIENVAAQPHEVFIMQLAPGRTVEDLLAWFQTEQGAPPARPVTGTTVLSTGEVNFVTADSEAGEYVLLCFAPDAKDGKPHIAHGMIKQIRVGA